MADADGKKLTELRVIDLKTELERRGLDKTGNKAALLDRLSKVLLIIFILFLIFIIIFFFFSHSFFFFFVSEMNCPGRRVLVAIFLLYRSL